MAAAADAAGVVRQRQRRGSRTPPTRVGARADAAPAAAAAAAAAHECRPHFAVCLIGSSNPFVGGAPARVRACLFACEGPRPACARTSCAAAKRAGGRAPTGARARGGRRCCCCCPQAGGGARAGDGSAAIASSSSARAGTRCTTPPPGAPLRHATCIGNNHDGISQGKPQAALVRAVLRVPRKSPNSPYLLLGVSLFLLSLP